MRRHGLEDARGTAPRREGRAAQRSVGACWSRHGGDAQVSAQRALRRPPAPQPRVRSGRPLEGPAGRERAAGAAVRGHGRGCAWRLGGRPEARRHCGSARFMTPRREMPRSRLRRESDAAISAESPAPGGAGRGQGRGTGGVTTPHAGRHPEHPRSQCLEGGAPGHGPDLRQKPARPRRASTERPRSQQVPQAARRVMAPGGSARERPTGSARSTMPRPDRAHSACPGEDALAHGTSARTAEAKLPEERAPSRHQRERASAQSPGNSAGFMTP
ncbi:hypothetical protein RKD23_006172 [Streptomyces sp. SAI-170]